MKFHEWLIYQRGLHDLSRKEVYYSLGVSRMTYYRYEVGSAIPTLDNLVKISEYYGVEIKFLTNMITKC